jgi:pimeloyl-ACP methyl ester carboxylesterase
VATVAWDEPFDRVIGRWMKTMTVPTMVMWGSDDALIPVGQAAAWADLVPDSELRLFEDAGHLLLDESVAAVAAVAEFCG